jgi:hypothetical protein
MARITNIEAAQFAVQIQIELDLLNYSPCMTDAEKESCAVKVATTLNTTTLNRKGWNMIFNSAYQRVRRHMMKGNVQGVIIKPQPRINVYIRREAIPMTRIEATVLVMTGNKYAVLDTATYGSLNRDTARKIGKTVLGVKYDQVRGRKIGE